MGAFGCIDTRLVLTGLLVCLLGGCMAIGDLRGRPSDIDGDPSDSVSSRSLAAADDPFAAQIPPDEPAPMPPGDASVDLDTSAPAARGPEEDAHSPSLTQPEEVSAPDDSAVQVVPEDSSPLEVVEPENLPAPEGSTAPLVPEEASSPDVEQPEAASTPEGSTVRVVPEEAPSVDVAQPEALPTPDGSRVEIVPAAPPSLEPSRPEDVPTAEGSTPISLHMDNLDVRKALEMLSRDGSMNIMISPGVTGTVTADLNGLSSDQALNALLRLCNLVVHREEDLVFVYTPAEFPQGDQALQVFPLDYVSAADVLPTVEGLLSPAGNAFSMESDPTDNRKTQDSLVVEDTPDNLPRIARYIAEVDRPPRQVLIEVHVLEVTLKDDWTHGVDLKHVMQILGNAAPVGTRGFVNPTASTAFFFNIDSTNLETLVECLKDTTDAKTLAAPRVLAVNGQLARIQIGEQLGYRELVVTETSTTEETKMLDLGVVLEVTPRISWDNQVVMHVSQEVSSGLINPDTGLPEKGTTEVETDVSLLDGQGVVVGGLIREKDSIVETKVPWLGNLRLIGLLFQYRKVQKHRTEIIIALVPRVVPYGPQDAMRDRADTCKATSPLLHGSLRRSPRIWDARLKDALHREQQGLPPHVGSRSSFVPVGPTPQGGVEEDPGVRLGEATGGE